MDMSLSAWISDTANDRQTPYSADSQSSRSLSDASPVSDAQAYVRAVKTGETQDRALYHTIERKRPEGKGKANPHSVPSHPGDPGFPEHGLSFAQRLYASALSHKSQPEPSPSNIPVLPPIQYASSSDLPIDGGSQASSGMPPHKTSTPLSDASVEVSQAFNATRGFTSRGATSPEAIAKCPRPPLPMSRVSNYSSMSRSHLAHPSAESAAQLEVRNPRAVSDRSQNVSMEAQHHHRNSVVRNHEASGPRETFVESRSPAIASGTMFLLPPGEQHPETAPSYPPPTFGERPLNPSEGVEADIAQLDIPSLATVSHEDGLPDSLLQPSSEVNQEDVPSYSLVDEQAPPPAFDDLQGTSATGASLVVMSPETLPQEEIWTPPSPPHSPQPVSRSSAAYDSRKAPAYPHLDQSMYSVSTSKTILQDSEASLPSIITKGFGAPLSDSSSTVPTKFQSPSWSPLVSSPSSPLPSDLHSLSISPSHSPDHQSIGTSHHPLSVRKSTISSPPLVNYNTKPISEQSGQRLFIPPALRRYTFNLLNSAMV